MWQKALSDLGRVEAPDPAPVKGAAQDADTVAVEMAEGYVQECYRELLAEGATSAERLMNDSTLERLNQWSREIEALAASDGLRLVVSSEVIGAGSFILPYAFLVRPDGSNYPYRAEDDRLIPGIERDPRLIEADWGETLAAARTRAGEASPNC